MEDRRAEENAGGNLSDHRRLSEAGNNLPKNPGQN
jgi:hypothetical protein